MTEKKCHIIPDDEKQCVWMTSGVISYKLCTRNYRCEDCLFDKVMRNEAAVGTRSESPAPAATSCSVIGAATLPVNDALFYNEHHCWARVETHDDVRIGIDGILTNFVARVKAVVLPRVGETVRRGESFAHIVQEKHILQLVAPVTGTVTGVNARLAKAPELIVDDSWESGWLIAVKPDNLEHDLRTLMFGKRAIDWYNTKEREVVDSICVMISRHQPDLGATMQDGGEGVGSLADMLTSEQYYQVLESLSRPDDCT